MFRRMLVPIVLVVALGASSCSSSTTSKSSAPTSATSTPTPATVPAAFTGSLDDFYKAPSPLPKGNPGELIRVQPVSDKDGMITVRIMYHSIDAAGRDQPVPGMLSYPTGAAPKGGWPVVSTAPGTVGLDTHCAISRLGQPAPGYGIPGVHVMTDYIGMVDGQRQRYLSGPSEAHSVIDAVRAARNIPAAHAGTKWVALGHSQGGHSALFTNQLAASYAPELQLLGTAVGAPATAFEKTFGPVDEIVTGIVKLMAVYGIAADHPELKPADYVGPKVIANEEVLTTGCRNEIINAFVALPREEMFPHNPITTPPAAAIVKENDAGKVKAKSPIFLYSGTKDVIVVPARVEYTYKRLCKVGQVTEYLMVDGADHGTETSAAGKEIHAWFADRLAGKPPVDSCGK